jgi:hypothetical protein
METGAAGGSGYRHRPRLWRANADDAFDVERLMTSSEREGCEPVCSRAGPAPGHDLCSLQPKCRERARSLCTHLRSWRWPTGGDVEASNGLNRFGKAVQEQLAVLRVAHRAGNCCRKLGCGLFGGKRRTERRHDHSHDDDQSGASELHNLNCMLWHSSCTDRNEVRCSQSRAPRRGAKWGERGVHRRGRKRVCRGRSSDRCSAPVRSPSHPPRHRLA